MATMKKRVEAKDDVHEVDILIYRQRGEELLKLIEYLYIFFKKDCQLKFLELNNRSGMRKHVSRDQGPKFKVKPNQQKFHCTFYFTSSISS